MAKVSNFNAYFTRKYIKDGVVSTDEPIDCAQLYNGTTVSENNSYYRYEENAHNIRFTTAYGPAFGPYYASYQPGLEYIPKKYYTYNDLFPKGWNSVDSLRELALELVTLNYPLDTATGANFMYNRSIIDPNFRFYYDSEDVTLIPEITIMMTQAQSNLTGIKRGVSMMIHFLGFNSILNPEDFVFGDKNGINYRSTSSQWMVHQPDGKYNELATLDSLAIGTKGMTQLGNLCFGTMYTNGNVYLSEAQGDIDRFFDIIRKIKIYPAVGRLQYNSQEELYYNLSQVSNGASHPNTLGFLADLSDCPYFPTTGFAITITGRGFQNLINLNWENGGPEANNPDVTDDPNDKDPGVGPGQDPNDKGGDGDHDNTSDDIKPPAIPTLSASGAGLITIYNPSQATLEALALSLWNPTALDAIKQYFSNPMDTILGLGIVPVKPKTGVSKEIMLGIYKTGVTAPLVDSDYVIVNCGSIMINRYYGSYLDYSPYTKIKCYLPYIGEVDINPDEVMTTSLMVLYYVNIVTGDIVAMICSNGSILYTVAGNCIRQLPLSSADYASIINTAVSAVSGIAMAVATGGVSSAGVAVAGAAKAATDETKKLASARATANNVSSANNLVGEVINTKFNYQHAGSIGTGSGQLSYQKPYLIIERPNLDLASNYKSFVGYPCNMTLQIGRCVGFSQIEASNLFIPNATDEEVAEIKELLLGGVII